MPESHSVGIEHAYPVPASRVFEAWTDPRQLATWAWAGLGTDVEADVDLRVGGRWSVYATMDDAHGWPSTRQGMCGHYVEIVPDKRLVYTLHWDAPVGYNLDPQGPVLDEIVMVNFADTADGCTVTFHHHGIPDVAGVDGHEQGDAAAMKLLASMLAGPQL